MNSRRHLTRHQSGLTYLEVLIATVLIAIALVPMMNSLSSGLQGAGLHKEKVAVLHALTGHLEQVLAEDFHDLDAAATDAGAHTIKTSYSDEAATIPYLVFLWRYDVDDADNDGDVFTGGEEDLLWVKVATADNSQSFETLLSKY